MKLVSGLVAFVFMLCAGVLHADPRPYEEQWSESMIALGDDVVMLWSNSAFDVVADGYLPATTLTLGLPLATAREAVFPPAEVLRVLDELGNTLFQEARNAGGIPLGRMLMRDLAAFYVLLPSSVDAEAVGGVLTGIAEGRGYEVRLIKNSETPLAALRGVLLPEILKEHRYLDLAVMESMTADGDLASRPRQVDHWAYFPDEATAARFADWAERQGYEIATRFIDLERDLAHVVKLTHEATMLPEDILFHTGRFAQETEALGGVYDGWETQVIRPGE